MAALNNLRRKPAIFSAAVTSRLPMISRAVCAGERRRRSKRRARLRRRWTERGVAIGASLAREAASFNWLAFHDAFGGTAEGRAIALRGTLPPRACSSPR